MNSVAMSHQAATLLQSRIPRDFVAASTCPLRRPDGCRLLPRVKKANCRGLGLNLLQNACSFQFGGLKPRSRESASCGRLSVFKCEAGNNDGIPDGDSSNPLQIEPEAKNHLALALGVAAFVALSLFSPPKSVAKIPQMVLLERREPPAETKEQKEAILSRVAEMNKTWYESFKALKAKEENTIKKINVASLALKKAKTRLDTSNAALKKYRRRKVVDRLRERKIQAVIVRARARVAKAMEMGEKAQTTLFEVRKALRRLNRKRSALTVDNLRRKLAEWKAKRVIKTQTKLLQNQLMQYAQTAELSAPKQAKEKKGWLRKKEGKKDVNPYEVAAFEWREKLNAVVAKEGTSANGIRRESDTEQQQALVIGWLKWASLERDLLKQTLLASPAAADAYLKARRYAILSARDSALSMSFLNAEHKRWEMPLEAFTLAMRSRILSEVRIAHHKHFLWARVHGDDPARFFQVGIRDIAASVRLRPFLLGQRPADAADVLFLQLRALGVPTTVEIMPLPFSEWSTDKLALFPLKLASWAMRTVFWFPGPGQLLHAYLTMVQHMFEECFLIALQLVPAPFKRMMGLRAADAPGWREDRDFMEWVDDGARRASSYNWTSIYIAGNVVFLLRFAATFLPLIPLLRFLVSHTLHVLGVEPMDEETDARWKRRIGEEFMEELDEDRNMWIDNPIDEAFRVADRIREVKFPFYSMPGSHMIRDDVETIVRFLRDPAELKAMGARPPRGVLITGDVGSGKSTLALAIAHLAAVPTIRLKGVDLAQTDMVGTGASNMRDLFRGAREMAPSIILIEGIEFFAGARHSPGDDKDMDASAQERESMLNQLLVEMDGFGTEEGVMLLATSYNASVIDPALLRPGRMDMQLRVPLPNQQEREAILRQYAQQCLSEEAYAAVDWQRVALDTEGYSPADLEMIPANLDRLASDAMASPGDKDELRGYINLLDLAYMLLPGPLLRSHWMRGLELRLVDWLRLRPSPQQVAATARALDFTQVTSFGLDLEHVSVPWTRSSKFPHAVWAAGRALVAALLPGFDTVEGMWLSLNQPAIGVASVRLRPALGPDYERGEIKYFLRSHAEKRLTALCGPHCAAVLLLEKNGFEMSDLCKVQMEEAKKLATEMVMQHGWSPSDSAMIYQPHQANRSLDVGFEREKELDGYVQLLFELACERAGAMLTRNLRALTIMVEVLCQSDRLSAPMMAQIMQKTGATKEEEPFMLVAYRGPLERLTDDNLELPPLQKIVQLI